MILVYNIMHGFTHPFQPMFCAEDLSWNLQHKRNERIFEFVSVETASQIHFYNETLLKYRPKWN